MRSPIIAIVGDAKPDRKFDPPMNDPDKAKKAAEDLGEELAQRGAHLLVYGGKFIEADVVRGFVKGKPAKDRSILKWYTKEQEPDPFPEESTHPKLFDSRVEKGKDWEVAFYRSISRADGIVLIGGDYSTKVVGQVAIGSRIPIFCLTEFGGAAARVWDTLSAGEDLPTRDEINLMAQSWVNDSASKTVSALFAQLNRRKLTEGKPKPISSILAGVFFIVALSIVPFIWGKNSIEAWMLFFAPLLSGGSGALIRSIIDSLRGKELPSSSFLVTLVLGLVAGGISGVLFVTAQLTGNPTLATTTELTTYAQRSIPFAVGIGFVAGLTSDVVFRKLLSYEVIQTSGMGITQSK